MPSIPCRTLAAVSTTIVTVITGITEAAPALGSDAGWQVVSSQGGHSARLAAVSFASADDGWAVGSTGTSLTADGIDPLIEHWDGGKWRRVPTPAVAYSDEMLTGVSSAASSDAWAVGWQDPYGTQRVHALLMHWNGLRWKEATAPAGAGIVSAVDARTPDDIWAVGLGLFEHFDGSSWTVAPSPRPDVHPTAVEIVAENDAWAVGTRPSHRPGYRAALPYLAHWNGRVWTSVAVPRPAGEARLASVGAAGPDDVWAVGGMGSSPSEPYVVHFDGTSWSRVPAPSARASSQLTGVEAVSGGDVWAVGNRDGMLPSGFAVWRTFIEHWDGSAWTIVSSPNDTRRDNFLTAVAASGGRVWAVGGDGGTLVERR